MARSFGLYGHQPNTEAHYLPIVPRLDLENHQQNYRQEKTMSKTDARTPNIQSTTEPYRISEWKWELLACIIGAAIIAGTLSILTSYHDKPVEEWPIAIQISTVVAFLAQVAQAALL
jgi:hypothetical protein